MDNQDKFKAEQKGDASSGPTQTKSNSSGPIPIQPDRSFDDTISQTSGAKITQISTELVGQTQDYQKPVNFAQGVILNIGNLAKGQQVMLLTSQTSSGQLSLLANSITTAAPVQPDSTASDGCPLAGTRNEPSSFHTPNSNTMNVNSPFHHHQHILGSSGHILARSASLCDTQNSYSQTILQRSQSQDGGMAFEGPSKSHAPGPQGGAVNTNSLGFTQVMPGNNEQTLFKDNPIISDSNACNFQSSLIGSEVCTSNQAQEQTQGNSENTNEDSLLHSIYTSNSDNTNSIVNSFLDELSSELMSSEQNFSNSDGKRSLQHLGDSFESLQASLNTIQGTDLNLDQLDLMDVPDLEQMCNELTNAGQNDLSSSLNMSVDSPRKVYPEQKNLGLNSKCDNASSGNSLSIGNISSRVECPHDTNPQSSIFPQSLVSNCSNIHSMNCNTNATNINSQANCVKCGYDPLTAWSNHGQGQGQPVLLSSVSHQSQVQGHMTGNLHRRGDNSGHTKTPTDIASITDFSPDWAYTEVRQK